MSTKECRKCHVVKTTAEFYVDPVKSDGLSSYCKPCRRSYKPTKHRKIFADDTWEWRTCTQCGNRLPIENFSSKRKTRVCKACVNANAREKRRLGHPSYSQRGKHTRRRYGINATEYQNLLSRSGGYCELCLRKKRLVADHDHKTNIVRGPLCYACNTAIGLLQDSPELLRKAAFYLEKYVND